MPAALISPAEASSAEDPLIVAVIRKELEPRVTERHGHARGQLLGATSGLLSVDAGTSQWVVPATHAVWIPPNIPHGVRSHGPFAGWSVYVRELACIDLPETPCILAVSGRERAPSTAHCCVVRPSLSTALVPVLCNIFAH